MNLFEAEISGTGQQTRLRLPSGAEIASDQPCPDGLMGARVQYGVRPEDLVIANGDALAFLDFRVDLVEKLGDTTVLYMNDANQEDGQVIAKEPGIVHARPGEVLAMTASPQKVHVFKDGVALAHHAA